MINIAALIQTKLLPFVEKPMRYVGNEVNIIRKDPSEVSLHGVLCFPDLYDIGMSHHGLQILYHCINKVSRFSLSRAFMPWADAEAILRAEKIPLFDLETKQPINEADWVGFSVQYELQYTNILAMLDLAHIPLWAKDRGENDPIIMCGGPCLGNPEPIAPFMDICVIGDGEESLKELCTILDTAKKQNISRAQTLLLCRNVRGVYIPSLFSQEHTGPFTTAYSDSQTTVLAAKIPKLDKSNYPTHPLVPLIGVVHSRLAIEIMRGCSRGCRFCAAGMYYRPVRERPVADIAEQLSKSVDSSGWSEIGLLSLSSADYSALTCLLNQTRAFSKEHNLSIALPSTRIDALTNEQIEALDKISPLSSCTIAPEAGSERLRKVINKDFTDETIMSVVQMLLANNAQTIKLYFMVGLPTETDEDIEAIVDLVKRLGGLAKKTAQRRAINVSISPFSPKPHTPFQWEKLFDESILMQRGRHIKNSLSLLKNVKVSYRDAKITVLETLMARGDRSTATLIHAAYLENARFDGWDECFNFSRWKSVAEKINFDFTPYLSHIDMDTQLPWHHISCGVTLDFLKDENKKAAEALPTSDCKTGACSVCGICPTPFSEIDRADTTEPQPLLTTKDVQKLSDTRYFYRISYSKGNEIRFLGHRDMVEVMTRSFMAARIPLKFSEGFSVHPRIAFGPPLSLGAAGTKELIDIQTIIQVPDILTSVNKLLPPGLVLTHVRFLNEQKPQSISDAYGAGEFTLEFETTIPISLVHDRITQFMNSSSVIVEITKKEKRTQKDIRPALSSCTASLQNNGVTVITALLIQKTGCSARASDLLSALMPEIPKEECLVTRRKCLSATTTGFLEI